MIRPSYELAWCDGFREELNPCYGLDGWLSSIMTTWKFL
jgi:hypothetical protein